MNLKKITFYLPQIILIIFIPLITVGFSFFESTEYYQDLIGTKGVLDAIDRKLLDLNFGQEEKIHRLIPSDREFINVWEIIRDNTSINFPESKTPNFIWTYSPNAHDYVDVSIGGEMRRTYFLPDTTPVVVGFCSIDLLNCQINKDAFIIGTIKDIKNWVQQKIDSSRVNFGRNIAVFSIIFGFLSLFQKNKNQEIS